MNQRRAILFVILVLLAAAGSYVFPNSPAPAGLLVPLEETSAKTSDQLIAFWQARVERDRRDFISLTYLGDAYLRRARETGDIEDYLRAEGAVREALALNESYETALAYLSAVLLARHDFTEALALARHVISANPNALQARGTIGDAHFELGHYAEAEAAYQELFELNPSPAVLVRMVRVHWLHGRRAEALDLMRRAAEEAKGMGLPPASAAWYQFQIGDLYFDSGRLEEAEAHFQAALDTFDSYYLGLAGMAEVRAAQGSYAEAISYYERALAISRQPDFLGALGYLYELTGRHDEAGRLYEEVESVVNRSPTTRLMYNRHLAVFYADSDWKVDQALVLAEKDLDLRQDIHTYDTLAWALYKNGRFVEAAAASDRAVRFGTQEASLYFHRGLIYEALGEGREAIAMLEKALAINPHFNLPQVPIARETLARLQKER